METGRLAELTRFPVKSMGGERLTAAHVGPRGVEHDRWWAVYTADGSIGSGKRTRRFRPVPGLLRWSASVVDGRAVLTAPDGRVMAADDPATDAVLTQELGQPLRIATEAGVDHHDDAPVHVVTTAALTALGERLGAPPDPRRFRANLLLDVGGRGFPEDAWGGRQLVVGDVVLRLTDPMPRCVMVDAAQPGLPADGRVLRALADRDVCLGLMAEVVRPGVVHEGDPVEIR